MNIPAYLQKGDTIAIVAPSRKISMEELRPAMDFFTDKGFKIVLGEHLFDEEHQFAGSEQARAADLQAMLDSPNVKAIWAARGGYGAVRIVDRLDFSHFLQNPKWLCGYSDFTVFHSHFQVHNLAPTIHATMPVSLQNLAHPDAENHAETCANANSLLQALTGEKLQYETAPHPLNRAGNATAEVVGGNLSMLYSLAASPSDLNTDGKILFIEDLDEYLYHIDRMMMNLKRSGKLGKLAGLIVGGMSDMHDNAIPFGKNAEEIVAEHCAEYDYPICFGFPAGHGATNRALRLGMPLQLCFQPQCNGFLVTQNNH